MLGKFILVHALKRFTDFANTQGKIHRRRVFLRFRLTFITDLMKFQHKISN